VRRSSADAFRLEVVAAKNVGAPIVSLDNCNFMFVRSNDVYLVAATKRNVNSAMAFEFLYRFLEVLRAYFGRKVDEDTVRNHFVLIYELLDECMDNGCPQTTAVEALSTVIKAGVLAKVDSSGPGGAGGAGGDSGEVGTMTSAITGSVDWRQPGKYKYRKNEVFIDVLEAVNLLMSTKGEVLRADVSGKIQMKCYLTGMPELKIGLNDKLAMEREASASKDLRKRTSAGIAIDDLTFHRCVRLNQFDQDRTISFIPPDGESELMKYRITSNVNLPFRVVPIVTEHGRTRVEFDIKVKGNFSAKLYATNVVIRIPTPPNTAKAKMEVTLGKCKYQPEQQCIVWKIKKFDGDASFTLKGEVRLQATMDDKRVWSRPPITMDFQVPMFTSSGLHVRFLKVFERSNYQSIKWVRYITRAGHYEIRI
jgi:AP-2 complex subunit mu-1